MSITNLNSLMATAEKLSNDQLKQSVANGTIPAYIGTTILDDRFRMEAESKKAQQYPTVMQQVFNKQPQQSQPPMAQQMPPQQMPPQQPAGIDQMQSNVPQMARGGIVSFADGGEIDDDFDPDEYNESVDDAEYSEQMQRVLENHAIAAGLGSRLNDTPRVENGISLPSGAHGIQPQGKEFYRALHGELLAKAKEMGAANPEAIAALGAAQSALETGYGKHLAGGNNYFGIKGKGSTQSTQEYDPATGKMVTIKDSFRQYGNMGDSAADYVKFLHENPRYAGILAAKTPEEAIQLQGKSGYATDPQYGQKLASIHQSNQMAGGGIAMLAGGGIVPRFNKKGLVDGGDDLEYLGIHSGSYDPSSGVVTSGNPDVAGMYSEKRTPPVESNPDVAGMHSKDYSWFDTQTALQPNAPEPVAKPWKSEVDQVNVATNTKPNAASQADVRKFDAQQKPYVAPAASSAQPAPVDSALPTDIGGTKAPATKSEYDKFIERMMGEHEDIKKQREIDNYMALMMAGLGAAGGTSPNALSNISQGAMSGLAYKQGAEKNRAAEQNALNKSILSANRYKGMEELARDTRNLTDQQRRDSMGERGREADQTLMFNQHKLLSEEIAKRQTQIENTVTKQFNPSMDMSMMTPDLQSKIQAETARRIAADNQLKEHYRLLGGVTKKLYGVEMTTPDYGSSAPAGNVWGYDKTGKRLS